MRATSRAASHMMTTRQQPQRQLLSTNSTTSMVRAFVPPWPHLRRLSISQLGRHVAQLKPPRPHGCVVDERVRIQLHRSVPGQSHVSCVTNTESTTASSGQINLPDAKRPAIIRARHERLLQSLSCDVLIPALMRNLPWFRGSVTDRHRSGAPPAWSCARRGPTAAGDRAAGGQHARRRECHVRRDARARALSWCEALGRLGRALQPRLI